MEESSKQPRSKKIIIIAATTFIVGALLAGLAVFFVYAPSVRDKNDKILSLQNEVDRLEGSQGTTNTSTNTTTNSSNTTNTSNSPSSNSSANTTTTELTIAQMASRLHLPVVTYERAGLLTAAQKTELVNKLVNPLTDYYSWGDPDRGDRVLVSLNIEVPQHDGDEYILTAIFSDGGSLGELFGKKGSTYARWTPTCMGECPTTSEYKAKYPD